MTVKSQTSLGKFHQDKILWILQSNNTVHIEKAKMIQKEIHGFRDSVPVCKLYASY